MDIVGDRKFVELPGDKTHELPPLLVRTAPDVKRLDRVVGMANNIIETEDMIPPTGEADRPGQEGERRKMDLAINMVDQYLSLVTHWQWGDSILEWIRQCEITFGTRVDLRNLLRADIWPHAVLELRAVAGRQVDSDSRGRHRESGWIAIDVPAAAADRLFFRSVSFLLECVGRRYGLSDLGAPEPGPGFFAAAGTVFVPGGGHEHFPILR